MNSFSIGDQVIVRAGVPNSGRIGQVVLIEPGIIGVVFFDRRHKLETFLPHELALWQTPEDAARA